MNALIIALIGLAVLPLLSVAAIVFLVIMSRWFDKQDKDDGRS